MVLELKNKIEAMDKIADTYNKTKADNIQVKDGNKVQLLSNHIPIGDEISVLGNTEISTVDDFNVITI